MNTNPKFSVIIPVYKAESFITKCIEGILAQTVTDFELILINDGSPDRSGEICEEYAKKDSRIKVFHKENGGPSSARNVGLAGATGVYVCFADADDTVDNCFLENFGICNTDIIIQGLYVKKENEPNEEYRPIKDGTYDYTDIKSLITTLCEARNTGYLVTRAFRRQIIKDNNLKLNEKYRVREDEEFIWRYMYLCNTFALVNKGAYHYDMPNFSSKYSFIDLDTDNECTTFIIEHLVSLLGDYNHPHIVNNINRLASNVINSYRKENYSAGDTIKYIQDFKKYYKRVKGNKLLNFKSKIVYYLIGTYTPEFLHKIYSNILSKK